MVELSKDNYRAAILVCSDRAHSGQRPDSSGSVIAQRLQELGWAVSNPAVCPDDLAAIAEWLRMQAQNGEHDLILTTGGTGLSTRDVTPEATLGVIERRVPGIEEAMRAVSIKVTPHAMLSRSVAGVLGHCLIVNLPGSPKGALENLNAILPALPHAIQLLRGETPDP